MQRRPDRDGDGVTWWEALDVVVEVTKHEPYRRLCSDENADAETREGYRALMVSLATGIPMEAGPTPEDVALQAYVARRGCCG